MSETEDKENVGESYEGGPTTTDESNRPATGLRYLHKLISHSRCKSLLDVPHLYPTLQYVRCSS